MNYYSPSRSSREQPDPQPHWLGEAPNKPIPSDAESIKTEKKNKSAEETTHLKNGQVKKESKKTESEKHKKPEKKDDTPKTKDEKEFEEKQEKRTELVERSLYYKHLYEEIPVPRDPVILARLLVAEHIIALHEQITHPSEDEPQDAEQLLEVFDYIGQLADKLEHPGEESSPEIQAAYDTIVVLAEDALAEPTYDPSLLVEVNRNEAKTDDYSTDTPDLPHLSPASVTLIKAIIHLREPEQNVVQPQHFAGGAAPQSINTIDRHTQPSRASYIPSPSLSPVEARQAYRETARVERTGPVLRSPDRIAAIAVTSALGASYNRSPSTIDTPIRAVPHYQQQPSATSDQLTALTYATAAPTTKHAETFHAFERPLSQTSNSARASSVDTYSSHESANSSYMTHKLEHLPLQSLLTMAETISIGHGRRLRSAYEKGEVDKEGLIKILKSHATHNDFLREYKQQVVRRRNLVQSSPEFLTGLQNTPPDAQTDSQPTSTVHTTSPPDASVTPNTSSSHLPTPASTSSTAQDNRQIFAKETATGWKTILTIAGGIAAIVTLAAFVLISS